jgi:CSLREA domain-containing protein
MRWSVRPRTEPRFLDCGAAPGLIALLLLASPARVDAAATFVVDSLVDAPGGGDLADGVCETGAGNGVCTLRAAVMEANHVPGGGATIVLAAETYFLTRAPVEPDTETSGDLDVTASMTIVGETPSTTAIDGNRLDRIFDVHAGADPVVLRRLNVRAGLSVSSLDTGGCILNDGGLVLEDLFVSNCESTFAGAIDNGARLMGGSLTIRRTVVIGGRSLGSAGGVFNGTGAALRVEDSHFAGGRAPSGGAISNVGTASIERTTFNGNQSTGVQELSGGGAIYNQGTLEVVNSTFHMNIAMLNGGAIYAYSGSAQLLNVTIADNEANFQAAFPGSSFGGGIYVYPGMGAAVVLRNSLVAGNVSKVITPDECAGAPVVSGDYNRIGVPATCALTGNVTHVNTTDLGEVLLPLASNGGFAVDRRPIGDPTIPLASCTDLAGAPLAIDSRLYRRGASGACYAGATELGGARVPEAVLGVELLWHGGAAGDEFGIAGTAESRTPPPFWASEPGFNEFEQVVYGGGLAERSDAPAGSGAYLLAGGVGPASALMYQHIDLSAAAAAIDAGTVAFRLAGAFGGHADEDDYAALHLGFWDASMNTLLSGAVVGNFDAADRGNETALLPDVATGPVPVGARIARAMLFALSPTSSDYTDGYADQLSLVLPEPSAGWLGVAVVALLRMRATRRRPR